MDEDGKSKKIYKTVMVGRENSEGVSGMKKWVYK